MQLRIYDAAGADIQDLPNFSYGEEFDADGTGSFVLGNYSTIYLTPDIHRFVVTDMSNGRQASVTITFG